MGDVFAFCADDPSEFHSAAHTRAHNSRLFPQVEEPFVTTLRRPILTLLADDSPGIHDMLIPACDPARYHALGAPHHRSCAQNLDECLSQESLVVSVTPQPINVFMNIPVAGQAIEWHSAQTKPGDNITFRAEMDCLLVVSACPQDLVDINGTVLSPLAVEVLEHAQASGEIA